MTDGLLEKILDRYGLLGALVMAISFVVLFLGWLFVITIFPIALSVPVLISAWMIWNVRGGKND